MGYHTVSPTCPSMSKYEAMGGGIPGSVRILGRVTQFGQNILNLKEAVRVAEWSVGGGGANPNWKGPNMTVWCFQQQCYECWDNCLAHLGRATHICVSKLTIIGSDIGFAPERRQAIIWTNAGILLFGFSGTNFSEILIEIHTLSFNKMHLKMSSGKWRPFSSASMC